MSPAVHFGVPGAGSNAWFGSPDIPELDELTTLATDQAKGKQFTDEIQKIALREVAYVP